MLTLRAHNRRTLLVALLRRQPIARVRLARETGLSTTTVTNLVAELVEAGRVIECGPDAEAVHPGAGRPPMALRVRPESVCAAGIHIGAHRARVAIVDLQANLVDYDAFDVLAGQSVEHCVDHAVEIARGMLKRLPERYQGGAVVGVGVGAAGRVDSHRGVNVTSPNLGWRGAPLRDLFGASLALPVVVDNNVRCMALAESLFGICRNMRALAFVYARVGVGAGLVVDGEVYRGADDGAGEIGHWVMAPMYGEQCSCGNRGCLETLISERVLLERAERLHPELTHGRANPMQFLFDSARDGHLALVELLEERAYHVGLGLANLVNVLNPQAIMLGGWLSEAFDLIEPVVERTMRQHAFGGIGDNVQVFPTSFGRYCGVIGAATLAFESFFLNS